jgi:hypothetical protein
MFNSNCISQEWTTRPDEERFTSLPELASHARFLQQHSKVVRLPLRALGNTVDADRNRVVIRSKTDTYALSHLAFSQLCADVQAPAGFLRKRTTATAARVLAECLQDARPGEDGEAKQGMLLLTNTDDAHVVRAVTGPKYGRIWNADIADALVERFGDGVTGDWTVPGEFGKKLDSVTKKNTTLYLGDSNMFVALANETDRIELPNRRGDKRGSLAQGIIVANSETGTGSAWFAYFLFDYICANRIIWGCEMFDEVRVRHTANGPGRWVEKTSGQMAANGRMLLVKQRELLLDAQRHTLGNQADVLKFLTQHKVSPYDALRSWETHIHEEGRPMETRWDAVTGLTALARNLGNQDERVRLERKAGALLAA